MALVRVRVRVRLRVQVGVGVRVRAGVRVGVRVRLKPLVARDVLELDEHVLARALTRRGAAADGDTRMATHAPVGSARTRGERAAATRPVRRR